MKIAVVKQVVSRGLQCLLMILVGYGSNNNSLRQGRRWSGCFAILTACILIRGYYLQYGNLHSLSDKDPIIVSAVIPVYASRKQGEVETVSIFTRLPHSMASCCRFLEVWTNTKELMTLTEYKMIHHWGMKNFKKLESIVGMRDSSIQLGSIGTF